MNLTSHIHAMVDARMQQLFLASSTNSASQMVTTPSASGSAMTFYGPSGTHDTTWIFYSGASYHVTNDVSKLHNCYTHASSLPIHTANATPLPVSLIGFVSNKLISLTNVLCVPHLSINLISISKLTSSGFLVSFSSTGCSMQDPRTGRQIETGLRSGGLYYLRLLYLPSISISPAALVSSTSPFALWHSRLGHLSLNKMKF